MSDKSKVSRVITATFVSTSGKYQGMLAEHIVAGRFCFDVIAFNNWTGDVITRHYRKGHDDAANRAEALRVFDEFREQMTAPAKDQETDEREPLIFINPGNA